jgi:flagellar biosynthetic protein FliR
LTEAGMGVLMRIVPQINVFAASLQVKVAIGLVIIILALPAVSRLMDDTMAQLYQRMQESFAVMLSGS